MYAVKTRHFNDDWPGITTRDSVHEADSTNTIARKLVLESLLIFPSSCKQTAHKRAIIILGRSWPGKVKVLSCGGYIRRAHALLMWILWSLILRTNNAKRR